MVVAWSVETRGGEGGGQQKNWALQECGQPLATKDLITLHMDQSEETGNWQCPVLEKAFTDRTKVVAIRQNPPGNEANVYSYEAVQELNFKTKNYEDLTSGKKVRVVCRVCACIVCMVC